MMDAEYREKMYREAMGHLGQAVVSVSILRGALDQDGEEWVELNGVVKALEDQKEYLGESLNRWPVKEKSDG